MHLRFVIPLRRLVLMHFMLMYLMFMRLMRFVRFMVRPMGLHGALIAFARFWPFMTVCVF
jgi:hypothetical protein